jgi:predicted anti-sigma-YlaC factor YlaD
VVSWLRRVRRRRLGDPGLPCVRLVELVTDYLEGSLPRDVQAQVAAHLDGCADCSAYFQQMVLTVSALRGADEPRDVSIPDATCTDLVERFRTWAGTA